MEPKQVIRDAPLVIDFLKTSHFICFYSFEVFHVIGCASTISVQRLLSTESMLSLKEIVLTPFLLTQVKEYKTSQRSRFCNSDKLKGLTDGRFEVAID